MFYSNSVALRFEHLPNELIIEIFEYLDAYDIHRGFSNLNLRFQNLLVSSSFPLKTVFAEQSLSTIEYRCRHVIISPIHLVFFRFIFMVNG